MGRRGAQRGAAPRASDATLPRGFPERPRRGGPLLAHCGVFRRSQWARIAPSSIPTRNALRSAKLGALGQNRLRQGGSTSCHHALNKLLPSGAGFGRGVQRPIGAPPRIRKTQERARTPWVRALSRNPSRRRADNPCPCGRGLHLGGSARIGSSGRAGVSSDVRSVSRSGIGSSGGGVCGLFTGAASESEGSAGDSGEDELAHALESLD